ncbi:MAG: HYR domain-containing protein [Bacteroidota bacterium]
MNDDEDPMITCPADTTLSNDLGECGAMYTFDLPAVTDNCELDTLTQIDLTGLSSGSFFPVGMTTLEYMITDTAGNSSTCSFEITVLEDEDPMITCPADTTIGNDLGDCGAIFTFDLPIVSDNCEVDTLTQIDLTGLSSGSFFPVGLTTLEYMVTDAAGNFATCSFDILVNDTEDPTISCPADTTLSNDQGLCGAEFTFDLPLVADNCVIDTLTQIDLTSLSSGSIFPVGQTTLEYMVTDSAGNSSTCSFTITVNDNEDPMITCPADTILSNDIGDCGAIFAFDLPVVSDNCELDTLTQIDLTGLESGSFFPVGTTSLEYMITDTAGNSSTCSFTITVNDDEGPDLNCPGDTILNTNAGMCSAVFEFDMPDGSDNCPDLQIVQSAGPSSGSAFPLGQTTLIFTATDQGGNISSCSYKVTVVDNENPTIICPGDTTLSNEAGLCGATFNYDEPEGSDNCPGALTEQTDLTGYTNGSFFPIGTTTLEYTVTDAAGNQVACSFNVTVEDNEAPEINCPEPITVNNDPGICGALIEYLPPVGTDNCPDPITLQTDKTLLTNGSVFPVGTTTLIYTVIDDSDNSMSCAFDITVLDAEDPTILCSADTTLSNDAGLCGAEFSYELPLVDDNCVVDSLYQIDLTGLASDSIFPVGMTTLEYMVTDSAGNSSTCSFTISVIDDEDPMITCPSDTTLDNSIGECGAAFIFDLPEVTDNCSIDTLIQTDNTGLSSGAVFPVGLTTLEYLVTDASGNSATCSFSITVNDTIAPLCLAQDLTVYLDSVGLAVTTPSEIDFGSSDECGIADLSIDMDAFDCTVVDSTLTITLTVTDVNGNSSTCPSMVTVLDTIAPVIECQTIEIYPDNEMPYNDTTTEIGIESGIVTYSDNCSIDQITIDSLPFCVPSGNPEVVVIDQSGNISTCLGTVLIVDTIAPLCMAQDTIVYLDQNGQVQIDPGFVDDGSQDNYCSSGLILDIDIDEFDCSQIGQNTVELTVTQAQILNGMPVIDNLFSTCTSIVTVLDTISPICLVNDSTLYLNEFGMVGIAPEALDNGSSDICGIDSYDLNQNQFTCDDLGLNSLIYTVTDPSGNASSCPLEIQIIDSIPPSIVCPVDTILINDNGLCGAEFSFELPFVLDNCSIDTLVQIDMSGLASDSLFPIGLSTLEYMVTDQSGNSSTCSINITVIDEEDPSIECPSDTTLSTDAGICGAIFTYSITYNDNCPGAVLVQNSGLNSGEVFPVGTTVVSYTVTDASGNEVTCSFNVNVIDDEDPVIECSPNILVNTDPAICGAIVTYTFPTVSDNCPNEILVQTDNSGLASGSLFPVGTTSIEYTVTDASGNSSTCSFDVTVEDNEAPVCNAQDLNIFVDQNNTVIISPLDIDNGSTDNCGIATYALSQNEFDCNDVGGQTVTLTVTDIYGNISTCNAIVTVDFDPDTELNCITQDISVELDSTGMVTVSPVQIDVSNNCGNPMLLLDISEFDCDDVGLNEVMLTIQSATDTVTCSANVEIVDPSVATCSAIDTTVYLDANGLAFINPSDVLDLSFSRCGTEEIELDRGSFDCGDIGLNEISITVTGNDGSVVSCTSNVTVVDDLGPMCNIPAADVYLDENGQASIGLFDLDLLNTDNCGFITYSIINNDFTCEDLEDAFNFAVVISTDLSGNESLCPVEINVIDTVSPMCVAMDTTFFVSTATPQISLDANELVISTIDNCGVDSILPSAEILDCNNLGPNLVTFSVADESGNLGSCSSTVTIVDEETPNCVFENGTFYLNTSGFLILDAFEVGSQSTDNCTIVDYDLDEDFFNCSSPIPQSLILTVTDQSGNSSSCSGEVIVLDTLTGGGNCNNIAAVLNNFEVTVPLSALFSSSDCDPDYDLFVNGSSEDLNFYCEDVGPNMVELEFVNVLGESETCIAMVNVQDNSSPGIAGCQNVEVMSEECLAYIEIATPSVFDNCLLSFTNSYNSSSDASDFYPVGVTEVTWTALDYGGNQTTCTFTVTVDSDENDTEDPVINGPADIVVPFEGSNGICESFVEVPLPSATDNCGIDPDSWVLNSPYADPSNGVIPNASGTYPIGTTAITWTVSDYSGNSTIYASTVTVNSITAPQNLQVNCSANNNFLEFSWDLVQGAAGYKIVVTHAPGTGTPNLFGEVTQLNPNYNFQLGPVNLFEPTGTYRFRVITGCLIEEGLNPNDISNYTAAFSPWVEFTIDCNSGAPMNPDIDNELAKSILEKEVDITVYPNPTEGIINFNSNYDIESIEVYTIYGQAVLRKENQSLNTQIDLSTFERNVYLIRMEIAGQIFFERVVVQ